MTRRTPPATTSTHVAGYPVGDAVKYVAIWEQGAAPPIEAHHGLSAGDYQSTFDDLGKQGYRPIVVSGYGAPGGANYAAIWENFQYSGADLAHIDSVVNGVLTSASVPGLSIAIAKGGHLVFAKGYGVADKTSNAPVHTSSLFRIASVTKPFTSTGIMKLVEAHKLSLSDKVFGPGSRPRHDLHVEPQRHAHQRHRRCRKSCRIRRGSSPTTRTTRCSRTTRSSQAQHHETRSQTRMLASAPGSTYAYSNFGYLILGRVIEKVTGQAYDAWLKANVLGPSGISDMQIGGSTVALRAANEVTYYESATTDPYTIDVARMDSHGGCIATPIDHVRFAVHKDGFSPPVDLLSTADETLVTTPTSQSIAAGASYGLGWSVTTANTWWHNGSLPGTTSIMVRTSNGMTWSAIANTRDNSPDIDDMMWNVVNGVSAWPNIDLF